MPYNIITVLKHTLICIYIQSYTYTCTITHTYVSLSYYDATQVLYAVIIHAFVDQFDTRRSQLRGHHDQAHEYNRRLKSTHH